MQGQESYSTHTLLTKLNSALSLAQVMPPSKLKKNLVGLINLAPEIEDNLIEKIQLPMEIDFSDPDRPFLKTEFNRQGNAYRSPYTNQYVPQTEGYRPAGNFRAMQETGAYMFSEYIKLYYGGDSVGNFYVLENQDNHNCFSCGFFAKKNSSQADGFKGSWDSFNIVDITVQGNNVQYNLNTTILIQMDISVSGINLTGFLKRNKKQNVTFDPSLNEIDRHLQHIVVIGEMIQDIETVMRQHLEAIYVSRTKQIIFTTRFQNTIALEQQRMSLATDLRKMRFGQ